MLISGFTFCRNVIKYDYPIVESIKSVLPVVDEFIVNVGKSIDDTLDVIKSIKDPKIKIFESEWDETIKIDGRVFSIETNKALKMCKGIWAFYIQADEVLHEDGIPSIIESCKKYKDNLEVLGFMFHFLHFYGDYWSVDPYGYRREIRIIRNNGMLESRDDATGFFIKNENIYLKDDKKKRWRWINARIFHYGWVKSREVAVEKVKQQLELYHAGKIPDKEIFEKIYKDKFDLSKYAIMKTYKGSHPATMKERIEKFGGMLNPKRNRWLNPNFYLYVLRHGFKG
ncbi:MAG: hypothetical protein NZ870_03930 [bacterium]|nr:hypothetical protein [bacterium]